MIKKVSSDFLYSFAVRFFTNFNISYDDFLRNIAYFDGNVIVGFISYSVIYERAEIEYIYVCKKYRGSGVSDALMDYLFVDVKGCNNVSLEVRSDNLRAINFYIKHGFKKEAVRKKYYDDCDGILMVKQLR